MKAIVYDGPGRLEVRERPAPEPRPGEVLLDVSHVGVCGTDLLVWSGGMSRVAPPVILGHEFSATVRSAPEGSSLAPGEPVVVEPLISCGACAPCCRGDTHVCVRLRLIGIDIDGAAADQVVAPVDRVHPLPHGLSLREAALAEPTAVACHMVAVAEVTKGDSVLVVGGGPIGVLVGLVARATGAAVVVSEPHPRRRAVAEEVGLKTFDPGAESLDALLGDEEGFDLTFELTALAAGLNAAIAATRVRGTVLLGGLAHGSLEIDTVPIVLKELQVRGSRVYRTADVTAALGLLARGDVPFGALITRVVSLEEAVDGAFAAVRDDKAEMKVLIDVEGGA